MDTTTDNPTPTVDPAAPLEAPAGTLSMALAILDEDLCGFDRPPPDALIGGEDTKRVQAAWDIVRAAALKSLEPAPAVKAAPKGTVAERAAKCAKTVGDAMEQIAADPSADAAAAIQVVAMMAAPTLAALMIEAVDRVADRLEAIATPLRILSHSGNDLEEIKGCAERIAASIHEAERTGWGAGR